VAHRAGALHPDLSIELYERDPLRETLEKIDPRRAGNQDTWLVPHRESQALLDLSKSALDPIVALSRRAVTVHPLAQSREVWLRFRGLAFARWDDRRVFFGCPDAREQLTPSSLPALRDRSSRISLAGTVFRQRFLNRFLRQRCHDLISSIRRVQPIVSQSAF
jgi:hypothetical protein